MSKNLFEGERKSIITSFEIKQSCGILQNEYENIKYCQHMGLKLTLYV